MQKFCIDYHFGDNSVSDQDTDVRVRYSGGAMSGGQMADCNISGLNSNIPCHRYATLGSLHYHSQRSGFTIAGGSANYEMDEKGHGTCGIFEMHTPDPNALFPNVGSPTHSIGHADLI